MGRLERHEFATPHVAGTAALLQEYANDRINAGGPPVHQ